MFVLFTDSDTDMTPALCKEYGYNFISMPYTIGVNDTYPYIDFEKFDGKAFYNMLRKDGPIVKTSALPPIQYTEHFEPFFKEGKDILYVHFSSAMSGTFSGMRLAVNELLEKYPERKFYEVDTKGISALSLLICQEVSRLYKEGKSAEEIVKWASTEVDHFQVYFFVENLDFFRRSGRVKAFSAIMGNILGIHPIIHIDQTGTMVSIDKCRGKNATISKVLALVRSKQDHIKDYKVIVAHTDNLASAEIVIEKLKAEYGEDLQIEITEVNPTIGSHCGPDAVGIAFHSKDRV